MVAIGEEEHGFLIGIWGGRQHGMVAGGMAAKDHLGFGWFFNAQSLRADGHATIAADLDGRAHAPHLIPPRAAGRGAEHGTLFLLGLVPGAGRGLAQFAMDFAGVAMGPQGVDGWVGDIDFGDFFTGKAGRQAPLPVWVGPFDFAFGLGGGSIAETDVVKLERPAQLGEGIRVMGEKETVVIDIDLQGAAVGQERGGQEVEVGPQEFPLVKLRAGEEAAANIEQIEHGEGDPGVRKPPVRRGVELPEFADLRALPAAHGGPDFFWRDGMGELVCQCPVADLGAVEFEGVQAEGFGSGEAVRTRRRARQPFFEEFQDGRRPRAGMVATRSAGRPEGLRLLRARGVIDGGQGVEATAGESQMASGGGGRQGVLPESFEHMADERGGVAMGELLILFKTAA